MKRYLWIAIVPGLAAAATVGVRAHKRSPTQAPDPPKVTIAAPAPAHPDPKVFRLDLKDLRTFNPTRQCYRGPNGQEFCTSSPIVFSLEPHHEFSDLLTDRTASYDLEGTGHRRAWKWLRPTTALLVWDPSHTGRITSGRQLFGWASFGQSWSDGYAALATLDANHDGQISGPELEPLAAWFDRNGNGQSDPGEVVRLSTLDVASIATQPSGQEGETLFATKGLTLADGTVMPTYDWVAHTAPELAAR